MQLWVNGAVLGAHYTVSVGSAFPFSLLSRSGRMTPSPLFKSALLMPYLWRVDLETVVDPVLCH